MKEFNDYELDCCFHDPIQNSRPRSSFSIFKVFNIRCECTHSNGDPIASAYFQRYFNNSQNDMIAQMKLALCYEYGMGTERDPFLAFHIITEITTKCPFFSQGWLRLGMYYEIGFGISQDPYMAFSCYNNASSNFDIGWCYETGFGVEKSYTNALTAYIAAGKLGDKAAQYRAGKILENGFENTYLSRALYFYQQASFAESNGYFKISPSPSALFRLSEIYGNDNPNFKFKCQKDTVKSKLLLRKAADMGLFIAQYGLSHCDNFSFSLLHKLGKKKYAIAQYDLALKYLKGEGIKTNFEISAFWFEQAAIQGHELSQLHLAECFHFGIGVKQNYDKAFLWYKRSADQNNLYACFYYGWLLCTHEYKNPEGIDWIRKAESSSQKDFLCGFQKSTLINRIDDSDPSVLNQKQAFLECIVGFIHEHGLFEKRQDLLEAKNMYESAGEEGAKLLEKLLQKPFFLNETAVEFLNNMGMDSKHVEMWIITIESFLYENSDLVHCESCTETRPRYFWIELISKHVIPSLKFEERMNEPKHQEKQFEMTMLQQLLLVTGEQKDLDVHKFQRIQDCLSVINEELIELSMPKFQLDTIQPVLKTAVQCV